MKSHFWPKSSLVMCDDPNFLRVENDETKPLC